MALSENICLTTGVLMTSNSQIRYAKFIRKTLSASYIIREPQYGVVTAKLMWTPQCQQHNV